MEVRTERRLADLTADSQQAGFDDRVEALVATLTDAQTVLRRLKRDAVGRITLSWLEHTLKDLPSTVEAIRRATGPSPRPTLDKIDTSDATLFERRSIPPIARRDKQQIPADAPPLVIEPRKRQSEPASQSRSSSVQSNRSIPNGKSVVQAHTDTNVPPMTQSRRSSLFSNESHGSLDRKAMPHIVPDIRFSPFITPPQSIMGEEPLRVPPQIPLPQIDSSADRDVIARKPTREQTAQTARPPRRPTLDSKRVLRGIARALLQYRNFGTAHALLATSRKARDALQPMLYEHVTLSSARALSAFESVISANEQLASLVHKISIKPMLGPPISHLPTLNRLLGILPRLRSIDEDWPSEDWDIVTSGDYLSLDRVRLGSLTSRSGWFEIGALVSILSSQTSSLRALTIGGAVVDREWQGAHLRTAISSIPVCTSLTALDIAQVMHEDTLVILLRMCPALESLKLGLQSVGTSDDDTSRSSIQEALRLVSPSLRHLTLRAPSRPTEDAKGLLDMCIDALPHLESIVLEDGASVDQQNAPVVPLCTPDCLKKLPGSLKSLTARSIVSFSTFDILDLLSQPEFIPVLQDLDLAWSHGSSFFDEEAKQDILRACRNLGITARLVCE